MKSNPEIIKFAHPVEKPLYLWSVSFTGCANWLICWTAFHEHLLLNFPKPLTCFSKLRIYMFLDGLWELAPYTAADYHDDCRRGAQ